MNIKETATKWIRSYYCVTSQLLVVVVLETTTTRMAIAGREPRNHITILALVESCCKYTPSTKMDLPLIWGQDVFNRASLLVEKLFGEPELNNPLNGRKAGTLNCSWQSMALETQTKNPKHVDCQQSKGFSNNIRTANEQTSREKLAIVEAIGKVANKNEMESE